MFTHQNKGSYNAIGISFFALYVVFTLQNKGSYNNYRNGFQRILVVFTLQNKGISPLTPKGGTKKGKMIFISKYKISKNNLHAMLVAPPSGVGGLLLLCLPFKIRAVTTASALKALNSKLCLPFKIRAVTTLIL